MLARFSVTHVKTFLNRVARRKRYKHPDVEERGRHFSELLQGLLPSLFPETRTKTVDKRRFVDESGHSLFARLLFACDSNFVDSIIHDATKSSLHNPKIIGNVQSPPQFKQLPREWREAMTQGQRKLIQPLEPLIISIPLVESSIPGITDLMTFSLNLVTGLTIQRDIKIDEQLSFLKIVIVSLARTACRRRVRIGPQNLELVFDCCCKFLDSRPEYIYQLNFELHSFLCYLIQAWDFAPEERPFFNNCLKSIL
ncbi:hypothetical protein BDZ45DRAFT_229443 [Acephala macrosclerotiorum]|nr:hypothetical protein BDZ45DRAFT_229443 [Acephala macrosclerotiorum]